MNPEFERNNSGEKEVERVRRHVEALRLKIQQLEQDNQTMLDEIINSNNR
jgi:DNA-binding PadR family transcriptional regulator